MTRWTNWAGTATASPQRVHKPRSVAEIAEAVTDAAVDGRRVRALGSGHSFTSIAVADSDAINLTQWTGLASADLEAKRVTVRSGTTLRELNAELDRLGLAMTNLGDIDAQTISGAISTGTHGTGAAFGGISTQIAALELVLADGTVVGCSADRRPELFNAARVGLGALGVISTVTLQCEPAFVLAAEERPEPLEGVLESFHDQADANDHFEFYWFPYGRNALVKRNNRQPAGTEPEPLGRVRQFVDYRIMENTAFGALCRVGRTVPGLVRPLGRLASSLLSAREYSDTSHRVFVTHRGVRFVESEFAVPRESLRDVLGELRALVPKLENPVSFPVEVRVAAGDDIWLSTAYGRDPPTSPSTSSSACPTASTSPRSRHRRRGRRTAALGQGARRSTRPCCASGIPASTSSSGSATSVDPSGMFTNRYLDQVLGPVT